MAGQAQRGEHRADDADDRRAEIPARRRRAQGGGGGMAFVVVAAVDETAKVLKVKLAVPSDPADVTDYPWLVASDEFDAYPWPHRPLADYDESVIDDDELLAEEELVLLAVQIGGRWHVYGVGIIPLVPEPDEDDVATGCT